MGTNRVSKFQRSAFSKSSTYVCASCQKRTRNTGEGETSCGLCAFCYLVAGEENAFSDGGGKEPTRDQFLNAVEALEIRFKRESGHHAEIVIHRQTLAEAVPAVAVPPGFEIPEGLSNRARDAAELITAFAVKHDLAFTGGGRVFYTPAEWVARGEEYGTKSELVVVYDGAEVGRLMSLERCAPGGGPAKAYEVLELLATELLKLGLYAEECTGWYSALYQTEAR